MQGDWSKEQMEQQVVAGAGQWASCTVVTVLARALQWHTGDLTEQELTNAAWAFATVGLLEAQPRSGNFNAQGLANTALAFCGCEPVRCVPV